MSACSKTVDSPTRPRSTGEGLCLFSISKESMSTKAFTCRYCNDGESTYTFIKTNINALFIKQQDTEE